MSPPDSKATDGKKPPAKKRAARKPPAKKPAPKKATTRKRVAKKPAAKKRAPRKATAKPTPTADPETTHGPIRTALEHTLDKELASRPIEAVVGFLREVADELDTQRKGDGQVSASLANVYDSRLAELAPLDEADDDPFKKYQ